MEKVALVTGSTNNIGKAVAETLSRDGYHVIVTSRHGDEAAEVARNLPAPGSSYGLDFAGAEEIAALFDFIKDKFGRIDALVNNVAYTKNESILDCDLETWELTLNTNLRSYYLCSRYAALMMKEAGGGAIVGITIASTRGHRNKFSYAVTKGAITSLTVNAALDLAPYNIRVNAVGVTQTGTPVGSRTMDGRTYENKKIPLGHIADPQDIADAVSFLVSDKARFITGATLRVDGGVDISPA